MKILLIGMITLFITSSQVFSMNLDESTGSVIARAKKFSDEERFDFALHCILRNGNLPPFSERELDQLAETLLKDIDNPAAKNNLGWLLVKGRAGLNLTQIERDKRAETLFKEAKSDAAKRNLQRMNKKIKTNCCCPFRRKVHPN